MTTTTTSATMMTKTMTMMTMTTMMQDDVKRLSWSAPIFNDGKVDLYDGAIEEGGIFVSLSKFL